MLMATTPEIIKMLRAIRNTALRSNDDLVLQHVDFLIEDLRREEKASAKQIARAS